MVNPSKYERIEKVLTSMTPDPRHFEGSIYPPDDVRLDLEQLDAVKHTPEYKKGEERSDAKILEKTFTDFVEADDWFCENETYGEDPDYLALVTFPATEIDDVFNHIDVIAMINNEDTGRETIPFAIDLTYNTDDYKMSQKFRWKHVYGKKDPAPVGVSEFGEHYVEKDSSGKDVVRTKYSPMKFRNGLKIPGFASAKYFEDTNDIWNPMYSKGRIDVMPRFVVGYSPDIADTLANGMPDNEYKEKYGEDAYQKVKSEYERAKKCAKWCTLYECAEQASDIRRMLDGMSAEETKWMQPSELEKAKKQIAIMDNYFQRAIDVATKQAETDSDEMNAKNYSDRDIVRQAIDKHSENTYILKNWEY